MPCYKIDGVIPVVNSNAYVHPTAVLIGDVHIGAHCYIGPGASLRGDFGKIIIKDGANVQDNCVVHAFPGKDVQVEEGGHIGHGAILHGCLVGKQALIGMNAVVMDGAHIEAYSIVGAAAFVKAGFSCESASLVIGSPAKVARLLTKEEVTWKQQGTAEYQQLTLRCLASMQECEPLAELDNNRPLLQVGKVRPKQES